MTNPIQPIELKTPHLSMQERTQLLMALNAVMLEMGDVTVSLFYDKQTKSKPSLPGENYVPIAGVSPKVQIGKIVRVFRKADNAANRRDGSAGAVRFVVASLTRGNGIEASQPRAIVPAGLRNFSITGFFPKPQDG